MVGWLRPVLRGIVAELVDEYCSAQYKKLAAELEVARQRIIKLELELSLLRG